MRLATVLCIGAALTAGACGNDPAPLPAHTLEFSGICDGSAAVRTGADQLMVAYDEKNSLYVFDNKGGAPLAEYAYGSLLGINDDEVDVEAAAVVSDGVWWIGSHGRDGDAKKAPNRSVLFKTGFSDNNNLVVLEKITDLKALIVEANSGYFSKKVLKKLPKKGGFNIEGMVVSPQGDLLVGLRSPLSAGLTGNALLVRLVRVDKQFQVREIYQLDLGDRGIRDIHQYRDGFLIIAGDVAGGGVFALYKWQSGGKSVVLSHIDRRLNPEALVRFNDRWLVLSDDGKVVRRDGKTCDELASDAGFYDDEVYFRAIEVTHDSLLRK